MMGSVCCADICGTIQTKMNFDQSLNPIDETPCLTYGSGPVAGLTLCGTITYCGLSPCGSCTANLDGATCGCEVCGNLPGTEIPFFTFDCSNSGVSGGELFDFACEDLDTLEELENEILACQTPQTSAEIYGWSAAPKPTGSNAALTTIMVAAFLLVPFVL
jgi:hypothetical protein